MTVQKRTTEGRREQGFEMATGNSELIFSPGGILTPEQRNIFNEIYNQVMVRDNRGNWGSYLIVGPAGSGKSVLLGSLIRAAGEAQIAYVSNFDQNKTYYDLATLDKYAQTDPTALFIDFPGGFDEKFFCDYEQYWEDICPDGFSMIIAACREVPNHPFFKGFIIIELKGSSSHIFNLLMEYLHQQGISLPSLEQGVIHPDNASRLVVNSILDNGLLSDFSLHYKENFCQAYSLGQGLDLCLPRVHIPQLEAVAIPKPITNALEVVNKSWIDQIARTPAAIYQLTPRQFEELTCELFEKLGYKVELTQQTHDGGKDLIILSNRNLLDDAMIVYGECKKHSPERPVSVELVRSFYGGFVDVATAGIMLTTSYYSPAAQEFKKKRSHRLSLIDNENLFRIINEASGTH